MLPLVHCLCRWQPVPETEQAGDQTHAACWPRSQAETLHQAVQLLNAHQTHRKWCGCGLPAKAPPPLLEYLERKRYGAALGLRQAVR